MEIKIKKSQNEIEIIKDDSIKYAKISKYTHILFFLAVMIFFIVLKINGTFSFSSFLIFLFSAIFIIYYHSLYFKNRHINEVLKINLENIKLEFLKDGDIVYSKDIPRWKVIKIKKKFLLLNFMEKIDF